MKGKRFTWLILGLFIMHSDAYLPYLYRARYSLVSDEVHVEYGSVTSFDPYSYLLENRHALSKEKQAQFPVNGTVDVQKLGEYDLQYGNDMKLHVVVEDTTPPKIALASLALKQNQSFQWNEENLASIVSDLSDNETDQATLKERLHCADIDTSQSGTQKVQCQTEDNSGNEAAAMLSVQVNNVTSTVTPQYSAPVISTITIPNAHYNTEELNQIREVAILVNQIRSEHGLPPLILEMGNYYRVGYLRTQELAANYSHTRPNGRPCYTIFTDYGLYFQSSGENIARGQKTAQQVVNDWMNSPDHRANILRPEFTYIVIGVTGSGSSRFWLQEFFS